jgi:hypothetical protein
MDQGTCGLTASGHDRSRLVASLSRLRSCAADTGASDHPAGKHAVALKYILSRRDSSHVSVGDRSQTRGTIGIFYTLFVHHRFGAVDRRR